MAKHGQLLTLGHSDAVNVLVNVKNKTEENSDIANFDNTPTLIRK